MSEELQNLKAEVFLLKISNREKTEEINRLNEKIKTLEVGYVSAGAIRESLRKSTKANTELKVKIRELQKSARGIV